MEVGNIINKRMRKYKINFELDLRRNPYKGKYIAFEGIDGAGKTVQAQRIQQYLEKKGKKVWNIHEPTRADAIGDLIHDFLNKKIQLLPQTIQYLYVADRIQQLENLTIPLLKEGNFVLSQRCFWSSIPYGLVDQAKEEIDFEKSDCLLVALGILSTYYQVMAPDITFYLKVSPKTGLQRLEKTGINEYYDSKLNQISKAYDWLVKRFPDEFVVIDGEQSVDEVTEDILKQLELKI